MKFKKGDQKEVDLSCIIPPSFNDYKKWNCHPTLCMIISLMVTKQHSKIIDNTFISSVIMSAFIKTVMSRLAICLNIVFEYKTWLKATFGNPISIDDLSHFSCFFLHNRIKYDLMSMWRYDKLWMNEKFWDLARNFSIWFHTEWSKYKIKWILLKCCLIEWQNMADRNGKWDAFNTIQCYSFRCFKISIHWKSLPKRRTKK